MIIRRSLSRITVPYAGKYVRTITSTLPASQPLNVMIREHLQDMRLRESLDPIPYSSDAPFVTVNKPAPGEMPHRKVSIIGCGQVGMATAYAMLNQTTAGTIALVDMNAEKLEGEAKDLRQGSAFHQNVRIQADSNYEVTAHSHLVIVTAGVAQKDGESRLNLLEKNVSIMQNIIPKVFAFSPDATVLIASNPCDIMTAVAAKVGGPTVAPGRIFGSGTALDSSRLRSLLGAALNNVDVQSVGGYIIGEHGDSSVPVWSSVRAGGVPILKHGEEPNEILNSMHREVVESAGDVIKRKGYTNWAIGLTSAHIGKAVLEDIGSIMPVSTCVRGLFGIEDDVFLSLPCRVGDGGVKRVIKLPLTDTEKDAFLKSAEIIWEQQRQIWDQI